MIYLVGAYESLARLMNTSGYMFSQVDDIPVDLSDEDAIVIWATRVTQIHELEKVTAKGRKIVLVQDGALPAEELVTLAAELMLEEIEVYYPFRPTDIPHLLDRERHYLELPNVPDRPLPKMPPLAEVRKHFQVETISRISRRKEVETIIVPAGLIVFAGPHFVDTQEVVRDIAWGLAEAGIKVGVAVATLYDAENTGVKMDEFVASHYAQKRDEKGVTWYWPGSLVYGGRHQMEYVVEAAGRWLDFIPRDGIQVALAVAGNPFVEPLSKAAWDIAAKRVWVALTRYATGIIDMWDQLNIEPGSKPAVMTRDVAFENAKTFQFVGKWGKKQSLEFMKKV